MDIKQFFTDERAVSPVIGVILMVAITVILAAVIGTFVLGLGQNVNSAPQAQIDFRFNQSSSNVNVTHVGGDQLENDTITVTNGSTNYRTITNNAPFTAGTEIANGTYSSGDTIRVIYNSPEGGSTSVIAQQDAP